MLKKIALYIFCVAVIGAAFGRIAVYFVELDTFKPLVSALMGAIIGFTLLSLAKNTRLFLHLLGAVFGGALGFFLHAPIGKVVLIFVYFFGLNVLLGTSTENYATVFGLGIGFLCGLVVALLLLLEAFLHQKEGEYDHDALIFQQMQKQEEIKAKHTQLEPQEKPQPKPRPAAKKQEETPPDPYLLALLSPCGSAIALAAKVASKYQKNLDAARTQKIINLFGESWGENLPADRGKIINDIIKNEKDNHKNIALIGMGLKKLNNAPNKKIFANLLLELALSDANTPNRDDFIFQTVLSFGFDTQEYFALRRRYEHIIEKEGLEADNQNKAEKPTGKGKAMEDLGKSSLSPDVRLLYGILETAPEDDDATLKKNYRRLASKYHPDKYTSKELPADMLQYAEEKFKDINYAYETIKKLRGIA